MGQRRIRFGVMAERAVTWAAVVETARRAEGAGFGLFLIRDHFISEPFGPQLAPVATLATVAAVTTTLRIGTRVICNDYRHPVGLAQEAATLDLLSEGRFELGIGAGFSRPEYEAAGIPLDPPGVRVARLAESIRVLKGLFAETPCTFRGTHYTVTDLDGFPKPVQRPHPPIHVAATGPRMLALAGREADVVDLQSISTATGGITDDPAARTEAATADRIGVVRRAAGDRFPAVELSMSLTVIPTDRPREAAARLVHERGWARTNADDVLAMPSFAIGTPDSIAETLLARRDRLGVTTYIVGDAHMAEVEPVIARLAHE